MAIIKRTISPVFVALAPLGCRAGPWQRFTTRPRTCHLHRHHHLQHRHFIPITSGSTTKPVLTTSTPPNTIFATAM
ncbi:unnamed protein product [Boreogadus saida]